MRPTVLSAEEIMNGKKRPDYAALVEIRQKNNIDGIVRQVYFDFGDDLYNARKFVQLADEALTRYNIEFNITYREEVSYHD